MKTHFSTGYKCAMFNDMEDFTGTLSDIPRQVIRSIQQNAQIDHSYDKGWVEECLKRNVLPEYSLAAQALKAGKDPYMFCRPEGGEVKDEEKAALLQELRRNNSV